MSKESKKNKSEVNMKTVSRIISLFFMIIFVVVFTQAQDRRAGACGAAFLNVGVGAKEVALGSATTTLSNDVNQIFWNPAGIALRDQTMQASFSFNKWFAELNHNCAAVSYNMEGIGTLGLGVITFGASDIPADRDFYPNNPEVWPYQIDKQSGSTYSVMDMSINLSYARYLMDNLSLGITAKMVSEHIDDQTATAFAIDFGTVYDIGVYGTKVAARMSNLGSDLKFYDFPSGLPLNFTIGVSAMPYTSDMAKVTLLCDAIKFQDGPQYFYSGAEVKVMDIISLRGGYKFNYSGTKDEGTSWRESLNTTIEGFSAGIGIQVPVQDYDVAVDYSYTKLDFFDASHRITVHFGLK
jgi:hypothetical protein